METHGSSIHPIQAPLVPGHVRRQSSQSHEALLSSPAISDPEYSGLFGSYQDPGPGRRPMSSSGESAQARMNREKREETEALLACMFGSTGVRMVSSTKLHVKPFGLPAVANTQDERPRQPESLSPRVLNARRTPLTRSVTAEDLHAMSADTHDLSNQPPSQPDRSSILITRVFSVDSSDTVETAHQEAWEIATSQAPTSEISSPQAEPERRPSTYFGRANAKQRKVSMYAVAIVLKLPIDKHSLRNSPYSASSVAGLTEGIPHIRSSSGSPSWQTVDLVPSPNPSMIADRNLEHVLMHWNLIVRTISHVEVMARSSILKWISDEQRHRLDYEPTVAESIVNLRNSSEVQPKVKMKKLKRRPSTNVQVPSEALQHLSYVQKEAGSSAKRIALGMRIPRVVTGQGRWGVWREEARWVGRWSGGREQNFFFFNLLTAFLGCHTEWLNSYGPSWYRRRHVKNLQIHCGESLPLQNRTVILSSDKMAARRLVFLLSAFLPTSFSKPHKEVHTQPDASWPGMAYSQSPPSGAPMNRQPSLRRSINRRPRGNRTGIESVMHKRSVSFTAQEAVEQDDNAKIADRFHEDYQRCSSDTRSMKSVSIPTNTSDARTRKSSTTITSTITPESAFPVPHFVRGRTDPGGTSAEPRPGSSGSLASLSLMHTLKRSGSNEQSTSSVDSQSHGRWGSMISGFWSVRRESSTDDSDLMASSQEGLGISGIAPKPKKSQTSGRLSEMVEEVNGSHSRDAKDREVMDAEILTAMPPSPATIKPSSIETYLNGSRPEATPAQDIPPRPRPEYFPVKLSIDESDGVVDVDLPMPNSYTSSIGSSLSSPKASQTAASSFNEHPSLYGRPATPDRVSNEPGPAVDIAGWLQRFHQDFALQAVQPYGDLGADVERAMRAEPTPNAKLTAQGSTSSALGQWTDICTTLIADTKAFSITRLTLRRRDIQKDPSTKAKETEEELVEEPIMDMDATLIDAVERILAQSGHVSRLHSRATSPSRQATQRIIVPEVSHVEVPRSECKKFVLGALEQVVKSVAAEQSGLGGRGKRTDGKAEEIYADSTLREGVRKWLSEVTITG